MRLSSLIFLLFFATEAFAALTVTSVSGASGFTAAATGTTAILYGGLAGADCSAAGSGSTCDSCEASLLTCPTTPLCACNTARVYNAGVVSINVKRDGGNSATGEVKAVYGGNNTDAVKNSPGNTGDFFDITWANLCFTGGTANCEAGTTINTTLKVYVDKNGNNDFDTTGEDSVDIQLKIVVVSDKDVWATGEEGIGGTQGFTPYPGDEKVYIENPETHATFPTLESGLKARAVRVYFSENGLVQAVPGTAKTVDLTVPSDGKFDNKVSGGLSNNTTYVFRVALVDEAGNVIQFFPDIGADPTCDVAPDFLNCPWAATPEKVLGLLKDDFNCFIATAAYGSPFEPKLATLREFRFKILLQHEWGRKFVYWYYKYGSMAGRWISDKPTMRAAARFFLYPVYWFTKGSLTFGFANTSIVTLVLLTLSSLFIWFGSRRLFGGR